MQRGHTPFANPQAQCETSASRGLAEGLKRELRPAGLRAIVEGR